MQIHVDVASIPSIGEGCDQARVDIENCDLPYIEQPSGLQYNTNTNTNTLAQIRLAGWANFLLSGKPATLSIQLIGQAASRVCLDSVQRNCQQHFPFILISYKCANVQMYKYKCTNVQMYKWLEQHFCGPFLFIWLSWTPKWPYSSCHSIICLKFYKWRNHTFLLFTVKSKSQKKSWDLFLHFQRYSHLYFHIRGWQQ